MKNVSFNRRCTIITALLGITGLFGTVSIDPQFGSYDFVEYWSAFRLLLSGDNPYNAQSLLAIQVEYFPTRQVPLFMWNPPWLLPLLAPVLMLPFQIASQAWLILNLAFTSVSGILIWRAVSRIRVSPALAALSTLTFIYPLFMTCRLGQVSALLLFGVALLFYALSRNSRVLVGVALALLSIKPHLFLLLFVLVFWWICKDIKDRGLHVLAVSSILLLLLLISASAFSPNVISFWLNSLQTPPVGVPTPYEWKVPTLVGLLKNLLSINTVQDAQLVMFLVPGVSAVALWAYLTRNRNVSVIEIFPGILCLSLFLSPFGWSFDHLAAAVTQSIVLYWVISGSIKGKTLVFTISSLTLCQLFTIYYFFMHAKFHHEIWWLPPWLFVTWAVAYRNNRAETAR